MKWKVVKNGKMMKSELKFEAFKIFSTLNNIKPSCQKLCLHQTPWGGIHITTNDHSLSGGGGALTAKDELKSPDNDCIKAPLHK
jgi:hypothetical protein